MANDDPHEHPCSAMGLSATLKAALISSVWKSTVDPLRNSSEVSSVTTVAPSREKIRSSSTFNLLAGSSSKEY
jgi:hypothetical protein